MERETLLSIYPLTPAGAKNFSNGRESSPEISSSEYTVVRDLVKNGHVLPGRDDHVLQAFLEQSSFSLLDACLEFIEYLPEWFLVRCFSTVSRKDTTAQNHPQSHRLLKRLLNRSFDHSSLVKELRKLSFEVILVMAKLLIEEIDTKSDNYSLEIFAWASALVESHFTDWTVADDSHATLFRMNEVTTDQIESMFLWEDVQGRLKALIVASKTADETLKEDLKYWHSLIQF